MILLDTNVISEPLRPHPDPRIVAWLAAIAQPAISVISIQELTFGVAHLPVGKRKSELAILVDEAISCFPTVLPFDEAASRCAGELLALQGRAQAGNSAIQDVQIAAIAKTSGVPLATRNIKDFRTLLPARMLINPWNGGPSR
ncbi:hypothetical protein SAMN06309944_1788 [Micrococcales bacterium KH10]|nr:hypothetical protein SAMN06309944_1788 [Micrococcales bacterium KH10]